MDNERWNALINTMEYYLDRARRLRQTLGAIDDPLAHVLLEAVIGAYEEAAAEADNINYNRRPAGRRWGHA